MDSPLYHGAMLVLMIVAFLGIWAWAWSRNRKPEFDRASRLPLEEDSGVIPEYSEDGK